VKRHQEVELNSTLIDEIQASSVVIESGIEITKLKLRMRNNTRQYLTMRLPPGAVLTHSLIDGEPVRPAVSEDPKGRESLLLPLRQSSRTADGLREHVVREGETLSDIANFYFSDPTQWHAVQENNADQLGAGLELQVGQRLKIPAKTKKGALVQESSFVIEVAYKRPTHPLGPIGRRSIELPELDVDTVGVVWYLYFPEGLLPLSFDANLTQYSAIRYDPFRRAKSFIEEALGIRHAWAGAGYYKSILSQRKVIWQAEAEKKSQAEVVLSSFPLVGERYRFRRILLGKETPEITINYIARPWAHAARWSAFALTFIATLLLLSRVRSSDAPGEFGRAGPWIAGLAGLLVLLVAAHFFLGVHRRILWGVDLALLVEVLRPRVRPTLTRLVALLKEPWQIFGLLRIGALAKLVALYILLSLILLFPLLLSSILFVVLAVSLARITKKEVAHAP
jgi:hypothetical protein